MRALSNNKREEAYSYKKEEEEGDSDLFRTKNPDQKKMKRGKNTVLVSFFDNKRKRGHKKPISFSPKEFLF